MSSSFVRSVSEMGTAPAAWAGATGVTGAGASRTSVVAADAGSAGWASALVSVADAGSSSGWSDMTGSCLRADQARSRVWPAAPSIVADASGT